MNINSLRVLLWIVVTFEIGGSGWTAFTEFQRKNVRNAETEVFKTELGQRLRDTLMKAGAAGRGDKNKAGFDNMILTDAPTKVEPPKVIETRPTTTVEPLDTLIRVVSIFYSPDPTRCRVGVLPKAPKENLSEPLIFSLGEEIAFGKGAVVATIGDKNFVEFDYHGSKIKLLLTDIPKVEGSGTTGTASRPGGDGGPNAPIFRPEPNSGVIKVDAAGAKRLENEGERLLEGATFSSVDTSNGKQGLRIDKLPKSDAVTGLGVQEGDILISVNGTPMSSKAEVIEYGRRHPADTRFEAVIMRKGHSLVKVVTIARS